MFLLLIYSGGEITDVGVRSISDCLMHLPLLNNVELWLVK